MKTTTNWRHIFKTPTTDYCVVQKIGDSVPYYSGIVVPKMRRFFGNRTFDCPLKPGRYYAMNIADIVEEEKAKQEKFTPHQYNLFDLPNGVYRCTMNLSTDDDSNAFFLQWQFEVRVRTQEDKF